MPFNFEFVRSVERARPGKGESCQNLVLSLKLGEHLFPLAVIAAVCVIANVPVLFHIVSSDPVQLFSGLATSPAHSLLPGSSTIDPSAGTITLSLGHAARQSWLSGSVPWWNPLAGLGSPLAGEMQSASFFPLVLLMNGWLGSAVFHLLLELIAGWSTYFLLRSLDISRGTSTAGGTAFALCGTFAWLQAPPANPVAFLPLCLLGVERCLEASRKYRSGGWAILALGLWLSVVSGFPPTAYLDCLLVALWALVRLASNFELRTRLVAKVGIGSLVGVLLSLPLLVAFWDYLPNGFIGLNQSIGSKALPPQALPQVLVPYIYGPIFAFHTAKGYDLMSDIWGNVGGYVDASLFGLALAGIVGRRLRSLRITLCIWVAMAGAKTFGLPVVSRLVSSFPGLIHVAFFRYASPSWELAIVVLAALAVDDIRRKVLRPWSLVTSMAVALGLVLWSLRSAWSIDGNLAGAPSPRSYSLGSAAWSAFVIVLVCAGSLMALKGARRRGHRPTRTTAVGLRIVNSAVAVQAFVLFCFPLLSAARPTSSDQQAIEFLQEHLGLYRFTTLGPISPNFGSYFGLAELNYNDIPVPKTFARHLLENLDTNLDLSVLGQQFTGNEEASTTLPGPGSQLTTHLESYESDGVRYVVVSASGTDVTGASWPPPGARPEPALVYDDRVVKIYQLPDPSPLFDDPGCVVRPIDWTRARASCGHPSTLVYHQIPMPGWAATIDGRSTVPRPDGVDQVLALPRGTSDVGFDFTPPHEEPALLGMLLGIATLLVSCVVGLRRHAARRSVGPRGPRPHRSVSDRSLLR